MSWKDPRMLFCFVLLIALFILTESIALGKVDETNSYGLPTLLECFKTLTAVCIGAVFVNMKKD